MEHKYSGRCVLCIKSFCLFSLCLIGTGSLAAPADDYDIETRQALEAADAAWTKSLLLPDNVSTPYDEQIFTELSPVLDSPQGVKLPPDQQLQE
jgi:hypothetical protein